MQPTPSGNLILFASGSGSNAENIIKYFEDKPGVTVTAVFTNNPKAGVIERCNRLQTPVYSFNKTAFSKPGALLEILTFLNPDLIVLAGFLWKIPESYVKAFPNKIINIHPALLPKYGGKGMYGMHVHNAVIADGARESGISIHYVNEAYDQGGIILQERVAVEKSDSPQRLAEKIHELEYTYFPKTIEKLLSR
ncbi:phosphoribosylglycinamide formyltransferase [Robiginitalea sp. IMCC44478]|uniref:phosphoribosylglycinamide formyltransferase n=1 Tax=Robiginitalea sp. IMCC44478 TaxID=3459122 RepID=UPI004042B0E2